MYPKCLNVLFWQNLLLNNNVVQQQSRISAGCQLGIIELFRYQNGRFETNITRSRRHEKRNYRNSAVSPLKTNNFPHSGQKTRSISKLYEGEQIQELKQLMKHPVSQFQLIAMTLKTFLLTAFKGLEIFLKEGHENRIQTGNEKASVERTLKLLRSFATQLAVAN